MQYRITKYNPTWRDCNDVYTRSEWTSVYDFARSKRLPLQTYLETEKAYIATYLDILRANHVVMLQLRQVENALTVQECLQTADAYGISLTDAQLLFLQNADENTAFAIDDFVTVFQLIIRELLWGSIQSSDGTVVITVGYDYYTYITCPEITQDLIAAAKRRSIYIERIAE